MTGNFDRLLALLTVPPELEEVMIDALLGFGDDVVFTSQDVHGHGTDPGRLSLAEQVSGRRGLVQFQVELEGSQQEAFQQLLDTAFPQRDFHCLLLPALRMQG